MNYLRRVIRTNPQVYASDTDITANRALGLAFECIGTANVTLWGIKVLTNLDGIFVLPGDWISERDDVIPVTFDPIGTKSLIVYRTMQIRIDVKAC